MDKSLIPKLEKEVIRIVKKAAKPGGLMEQGLFTMSSARSKVEKSMGFDSGELSGKEWKGKVKELVQNALDNIDDRQSEAGSSKYPSPSPSPPRQGKKGKSKSASSARSKRDHSSGEEEVISESPNKAKKAIRTAKRKKVRSPTPSESEAEEQKGDIDSDEEDDNRKSPASTSKFQSKSKSTSTKKASPPKEEEVSGSDVETSKDVVEEERQARMSDSDMSSVYDEPPSRARKSGKRKSKSASVSALSDSEERSTSKKSKGPNKKEKDPNEGLSPDEAKVANLKRIVIACGVRKQWTKEFADCPTTSSQIRHLQNLLSSLGMKGTPTIGKAKSLKEKRELAQELDDVRTFEAARGVSSETRASRSRASSGVTKKKKVLDPDDESDADTGSEAEDADELNKDESALGAVLDFLGGDSDSE